MHGSQFTYMFQSPQTVIVLVITMEWKDYHTRITIISLINVQNLVTDFIITYRKQGIVGIRRVS